MTLETLKTLRTDQSFALFWLNVNKKAAELEIEEPKLPRRRKLPRRFEEGVGDGYYSTTKIFSLTTRNATMRLSMS